MTDIISHHDLKPSNRKDFGGRGGSLYLNMYLITKEEQYSEKWSFQKTKELSSHILSHFINGNDYEF